MSKSPESLQRALTVTVEDLIQIRHQVPVPWKLVWEPAGHPRRVQRGPAQTQHPGVGMEYRESRLYQPGDDARHIHWQLTAKHEKAYTKRFEADTAHTRFFLVDMGPTLHFGTVKRLKSVSAAYITAYLYWQACVLNEPCGGTIFNAHRSCLIQPGQDQKTRTLLFQQLTDFQSEKPHHITPEDPLPSVLDQIQPHLEPSSILYCISDFFNLTPQVTLRLVQLKRYHTIVPIRMTTPFETQKIKRGVYPISDGKDQATRLDIVNPRAQDQLEQFFLHQKKNYIDLCQALRAKPIEISTCDSIEDFTQHFAERVR
jgi:uncharacterized protein (DUF58 family)